jgi:putative membrane-bound dehydrogenase-like protein
MLLPGRIFAMPRFALLPLSLLCTALSAFAAEGGGATPPAGNEEVLKIMETFSGRGTLKDDTPPTPPEEALKKFTLRKGLTIDLMASEPDLEQPLCMTWDSRGRLWVTLYRQYQFPAGLKIVKYDQHLRAVFDRVPEAPPHGPKGADKVVVLEDTNGDGTLDSRKTVIEGLNIATSAIAGAGGIWVLNPPYLLYYPDANRDDIPDGEPEVRLSGFGLEDTHAVANSLQFGPDGWLYGANGSTTTGNVSSKVTKNITWEGQCLWRYHPATHVFEIYGEGSGNPFSMEIDARGRFFASTNGNQRGMHFDQGMYGEKNFGKHGPLTNPYAMGWFPHMETKGDGKRFSQAICVYDGDLMADRLGGRYIAANSLHNMVYVSQLEPLTSTFRAVDEEPLLTCTDRWFRPVDCKVGPDGGIYLADWYDTRLSHVRPVDDWHKTSGRIYRIRPEDKKPALAPFDLHTIETAALVKYLDHPHRWFRRQAALELGWREESSALATVRAKALDGKNPYAFDALSALHLLGGLDESMALDLLKHPDPYVRRWTVRCLGDEGAISTQTAAALKEMVASEPHAEVVTQILSSAKRLDAETSLPLIRAALQRESAAMDARLPLMVWWALEHKCESDRAAVLSLLEEEALWQQPLARTHAIRNLAQRWAMAGGKDNYDACTRLLELAQSAEDRTLVVEAIASAFEGGKMPELPPSLAAPLADYIKSRLDTDLELAVRTGSAEAVKKALAIAKDKTAPLQKRAALIQALAEAGTEAVVPVMVAILSESGSNGLKKAVLPLTGKFTEMRLPQTVIKGYESRYAGDKDLQDAAHRMLVSRKEWAALFLSEVDAWRIKSQDVAPDIVSQLASYGEPGFEARIGKHWPQKSAALADKEKQAELARIKAALAGAPGDPGKGKVHYSQRCAICHILFTEGAKIGPDLTGYERNNAEFWLTGILAPSIEIREGYGAYIARLRSGQVLMGIMEKQDAGGVVLKDMAGQRHTARAADLESLDASPMSMMPEGLLGGLSDADLRDLFAYLMKE